MVSLICFLSCASAFLVLSLLLLSSLNCLPPVFADMQISITAVPCFCCPPSLLPCSAEISRKLRVLLWPPCVQVPAPRGDSAARLHCALKSPVCFPTTHKLFQDFTCALLISLIIPFPMTDSIPCTGFAALRSFCLLVQKLSLYLLLSAVATLAFCFVGQTSSVSLLSTSKVLLPSTC